MAKRTSTQYQGVTYREEFRLGSSTQTEKVFYIRYRTGGRDTKLIEERVGRESEGMTAAKASQERALRARGVVASNQEKREAVEAAKKAEEEKPIIDRLWHVYDETEARRRSRDTDISRYKLHLEKPFGEKTPGEIVTLDIDRLRVKLLKTHSPQTVKHVLSLLSRVINFGVKRGLCPMVDPSRLHFASPLVDNQRTENLTDEQMVAYLKALDEEPDQNAAAFIRLALSSGMRKGAIMALQWADIDFERGFITLRGGSAKKQKTERIPLSGAARAVLERVERTASPYVFPGRNGGKRKDFKRIPKRVRDKAGLSKDDFRPLHGLRHTFASRLASSGAVDLYTLQKMLTHGSPQMTQRYAHLADEALQRAGGVVDVVLPGVSGDKAAVLPFPKKKQA